MTSFYIFKNKFSTIQSLKDFTVLHGIIPTGNKSFKSTWINAITAHYLTAQDSIITIAVQAEPIASTIAAETEKAAVTIGTVVVKALTSETAVLAYRVILKTIAFALVMGWLVAVAAVKWCWEHRADTAVYHWIKDAAGSEFTLSAVTYMMLGEWVLIEWIDSIRSAVTSAVTVCRVWVGGLVADARSVVG